MKLLHCIGAGIVCLLSAQAAEPLREQAVQAMKRAADFYTKNAANHGGYLYYYSLDFTRQFGEGVATKDTIWIQEPGTPAVGMALLRAHEATGDGAFLDAAKKAAEALVYAQLESGGWQNHLDFLAKGKQALQLRNGRQTGRNYSTFDDGVTQGALRFMMRMDKALEFANAEIHESAKVALDAVLDAQFPNGAFPQAWSEKVEAQTAEKASFPDYDWRTEHRVKEYWKLPTLNDDLATDVVRMLEEAATIYGDKRCVAAIAKLGDFLIMAQMPEPQPAWAQQYTLEMRPAWARKFEPPAIAGRESEDVIEALIAIHRITGNAKYLAPIPSALAYLRRSLLPDGRLARYYELKTNKPLYMTADYELTNDDSNLPKHYGWKDKSHLDSLEDSYAKSKAGRPKTRKPKVPDEDAVREIIAALDAEGRWVSTFDGEGLMGQAKFKKGEQYLASAVFCKNLTALAEFVAATKAR